MGKPAARITDLHVCPMVTGIIPHVGGPVMLGEFTVLTGKMPQARVGDVLTCVGPPDAFAMGSMGVIVGGMAASRVGDLTVHGGSVTLGCFTVLIGETGAAGAGSGDMAMVDILSGAGGMPNPSQQAATLIAAHQDGAPFCTRCQGMSEPTEWYALVDGAADPVIEPTVKACRNHVCLFSGKLQPDLAAASPWLVAVDPREPLLHAWQDRGRGKNWGLMIEAALDLAALRKLLRTFLQAKLPDGELVMFRFYDPRVFRTYIASAPMDQVARWFVGVKQYAVEGAEGAQHSFRLRGSVLFDGDAPIGDR